MSSEATPLRLLNFEPDPLPLTVRLTQEHWIAGTPEWLATFTVAVDAWTAGKMLCPKCHKKNMMYRPFHRDGTYRAVAVCKTKGCGGQEEV